MIGVNANKIKIGDVNMAITKKELDELRSFAELEGTEVEDVIMILLSVYEGLSDYLLNENLLPELENEFKAQLAYFQENYVKIIENGQKTLLYTGNNNDEEDQSKFREMLDYADELGRDDPELSKKFKEWIYTNTNIR